MVFRGSGPVLLRNPIFLWFFRGGSEPPAPPPPASWSAHGKCAKKKKKNSNKRMYYLTWAYLYIHSLCIREAMALAGMRACAIPPAPSLLVDAASTKITCVEPFVSFLVLGMRLYFVCLSSVLWPLLFSDSSSRCRGVCLQCVLVVFPDHTLLLFGNNCIEE